MTICITFNIGQQRLMYTKFTTSTSQNALWKRKSYVSGWCGNTLKWIFRNHAPTGKTLFGNHYAFIVFVVLGDTTGWNGKWSADYATGVSCSSERKTAFGTSSQNVMYCTTLPSTTLFSTNLSSTALCSTTMPSTANGKIL